MLQGQSISPVCFSCSSQNNFFSFRKKDSTPLAFIVSSPEGPTAISRPWQTKKIKYTSSVLHLETLLAGIPATVGRSLLCCSQRKGRHGIGDLKDRKTADRRCACCMLASSRAPARWTEMGNHTLKKQQKKKKPPVPCVSPK